MTALQLPEFPVGFSWGVSTSAYQIEGAADEGGRGRSIWDTFAGQAGRIADGSSAAVACDHYHRYAQDVALLSELGVGTYRFSIAWPRVQPTGSGPASPRGLAFYDELVDALLGHGIEPMATLYYWDLPQALQDAGGWRARDTAARFAEYAALAAARLADRVGVWITLNEPLMHQVLGHVLGLHAPGVELAPAAFGVIHHQLLGHGLAAAALRAHGARQVGIANSYSPAWAVGHDRTIGSATQADVAAAEAFDIVSNRLCTDPLLLARYPPRHGELLGQDMDSVVRNGDLATISQPLDVLGVNYYAPTGVSAPDDSDWLPFRLVPLREYPRTAMGWPVAPDGLRQALVDLRQRYADALPPVWVTENGCACEDRPGPDGSIRDDDRIAYFDAHIRAVAGAIADGVDVRGYCAWSLLDNWEWAEGFTKRFGLVHVDHASLRRTPKSSFAWYRSVIQDAVDAVDLFATWT